MTGRGLRWWMDTDDTLATPPSPHVFPRSGELLAIEAPEARLVKERHANSGLGLRGAGAARRRRVRRQAARGGREAERRPPSRQGDRPSPPTTTPYSQPSPSPISRQGMTTTQCVLSLSPAFLLPGTEEVRWRRGGMAVGGRETALMTCSR